VERQLVPFAYRDENEFQARRLGLFEHARTFQEDETWLTPVGEALNSTDDLVVRAAD
jgi:hypothetical protein